MDRDRNYQKELDSIIGALNGRRPSLLLHACCAPCSSYCLEYLCRYFDVTLFFYNPNISDKREFDLRYCELVRLVEETGCGVAIVCPEYDSNEYTDKIAGLENCPERGERCSICYALRLKKTYEYASSHGFEYFCSTLSISPHKDADRLNAIGQSLAKNSNVKFLPNDFKKKGGYLRSIELSKEYGLYRQNFCGCVYSKPFQE